MLKIIRLYNRNRKIIWVWLIIAIFCIAIINLVQYADQERFRKQSENVANQIPIEQEQENSSEIVDYNKAAQSLTAGGAVDNDVRDEIQEVLEQFIQYVCNQEVEQAYQLLTEECKAIQYPSIDFFEQDYCQDVYHKTYTFQSWSSTDNIYVYQVKFFDDMLSSGIDTTKNYLQDYITVLKKGASYKININNFIKAETVDAQIESNKINFQVNQIETYLDYQIYEIEVTNNSFKNIILDTREKDNSVYVKNSDGLKIRALLYENTDEDLIVQAGESKKIEIKFNNTYNGNKRIISVGFSDIVIDQNLYQEDSEKGKIEIEIYL